MIRRLLPSQSFPHDRLGEFLLCALIVFLPTAAFAQTATVRGFVTSEEDGQPLPGVNVILADESGGLRGAATDSDGFYAISRVPPGGYGLRVTFIGFLPFADTLLLDAGEIVTRSIVLSESRTELDEVVVETERETGGAASVSAGVQSIRARDIELVPAPDISADLANYLTTLPGVVSAGDRGGQLFIRGGEPTQNLVLLDGILVYQPFHVIGFFSAFPSEIITSADIYAGGFGGRYGGRLSSVIDVSARTGNKRRFAGAVSLAPFVSTARLEGPVVQGTVSVLASVRESVIEHGAARLVDEELPFGFGDRFAKIHANLSAGAQLSVTALQTTDHGILGVDPLDIEDDGGAGSGLTLTRDEVGWQNDAVGGRFIVLPATMPVHAEILISYSRLTNRFGPSGNALRSMKIEQYGTSVNITHFLGNIDFSWGLFVNSSRLDSDLGGKFQNIELNQEFVTEAGFYVEPEFRTRSRLRIQPGLRVHSFPSKSRTFVEPRFRVAWDYGTQRLSAAAGLYHQEFVGLNDRRDAGDVFTAWTTSPLGLVPEALHVMAGWRISPVEALAVSIEGFYKNLSDLVIPEWTAFPRLTTILQPADGHVIGGDVRVEFSVPTFYAAATYGLSRVEYESPIPALEITTGHPTTNFSPPHDRRHQLNAILSASAWNFDFSVRWQLSSGLPFNESLGFDRFILLDTLVNVGTTRGDERVLYQSPYTGRLPYYHRLDVSVDREFTLAGRSTLTVQLGAINAYDRRNLFYLDLFTLRRVDQLPLIPTLGLKLEVE